MAERRLSLSARQARRIAIHAQGLSRPRRHALPGARHLRRLAADLGVIQIDSVNVLARAHYLPAFSRLGAYPRTALEAEAWGKRPSLFEYWGHECSLLPLAMQPLFRWRMDRARAGRGTWSHLITFARERRDFIDAVLARIAREGPLTGGDFAEGKRQAGWWEWSHGKQALEWLFWAGLITTRTRRGFERVYDLTERVLPKRILNLPTPSEADAHRELLKIAARALGVATEGDLRDYFRLPVAETRTRLAELVEDGALAPAHVQGWRQSAYLTPGARAARPDGAAVLISPFDSLIWRRERAERLFGTRIRIEIYVPAERRQHGYYVLPFLQGETITARLDLKAGRAAGALEVQAAHLEPGAEAEAVVGPLAGELRLMADWLGLDAVRINGRGDLAAALAQARIG
ncbi:MAG TPA: crosslink repair DNA glycosylase YcaQ family protein [Caulobacteraceae bacterium]|nr:crosslink repair DNA glycosylase YcaQ family protein [Caulobacteraceae bacterium]